MNIQRLKQNGILRIIFYPYIQIKRFFIRRSYRQFDRRFDDMMQLVRSASLDIELKEFKGVFSVGLQSLMIRHILKEGGYERELTELVEKHLDRNRDVIDIGANIGFFSVLFSKSIASKRQVLCVEPSEQALERLKQNLEKNQCENVTIHKGALGSGVSKAILHVVPGKEEYASLQPLEHQHIRDHEAEKVEVSIVPLDQLVAKFELVPGFIKMDVEGAEFEVLKGAKEVLKKHHPVILSEMDNALLAKFNTNVKEVVTFFEEIGYSVVDARTGGPAQGGFSDNILAFPNS